MTSAVYIYIAYTIISIEEVSTERKVEEEDEARGQTHRLNANEIVGDQRAEYTANEGECDSRKTLNVSHAHAGRLAE